MKLKEFNEPESPVWYKTGYMHKQRYEFAGDFVEGKKVLNVGCGPGYAETILLKFNPQKIVSIDYDGQLIGQLKNKNHYKNVFYKQVNAEQLQEVEEKFDIIISFENIEHLQEPVRFLQSLKHVAKENAVLLISTPNAFQYSKKPKSNYKNPFHVQEWLFSEFVSLLTPYVKSLQTFGQVVNMQEEAFLIIEDSLRAINSLWVIRLEKLIRKIMRRPITEFQFLPLLTKIEIIDAINADKANTFLFVATL